MTDCFEIYHLTEDKNYFNYLVNNIHNFWTLLSCILFPPSIDVHVKWDIYLRCPHQVVPKFYLNNKKFFDEWLTINYGKEIILNQGERFLYEEVTSTTSDEDLLFTRYSADRMDELEEPLSVNNITEKVTGETYTFVEHRLQGEFIQFDPHTGERTVKNYINNKQNGFMVEYYPDDKIFRVYYYVDNKLQAGSKSFYPDGTVASETRPISHNEIETRTWYQSYT